LTLAPVPPDEHIGRSVKRITGAPMFEILPNPSLATILVVVRSALLIGACWIFALAFIRWRRADERHAQRLNSQLERAFVELRSLHETVSVMSARLDALSERAESETRLAPAGPVSAQRGYDLAARLAKNGAAIEEIVNSCGITRHEAELLSRLHAAKGREPMPGNWQVRMPMEKPAAPARPMLPAAAPAAAPAPAGAAGRKRGSLLSVVG
jgi:hypothetical protein